MYCVKKKRKIAQKTALIALFALLTPWSMPLVANEYGVQRFEQDIHNCLNNQKNCTKPCVLSDEATTDARQCIDACLSQEHRCIATAENKLFSPK